MYRYVFRSSLGRVDQVTDRAKALGVDQVMGRARVQVMGRDRAKESEPEQVLV